MARPDVSAALATHVVNPVMRPLIRRGFFPSVWTLLETTGRRSGEPRTTPVGYAREGDTVWVVAERGRASAYVKNLLADPQVRVLLDRRWRTGRATPVDDDDALARRRAMDAEHGLMGRIDGATFRANATDPLTIRIDLDPDGEPVFD